jgi:hypothetical protein
MLFQKTSYVKNASGKKICIENQHTPSVFLIHGHAIGSVDHKTGSKKELRILSLNTRFGLVAVSIFLLQNE